ncbi:MAG: FAD-dependent oxidoreductase [Deltaproteobacteria bacterium]|nr:FAD-dependent oxidoreductase [Deltaproteobacteria bacterium]
MKKKAATKTVVILGAGLAGLSAAYHLKRGYRLVEKEPRPGGLVRTDARDGFLFDRTGHWLHLRDPRTKRLVADLLPGMRTHERHAAIYSKGVYTAYPFQANLFGLPPEVVAECLAGYINAFFNPPQNKGKTFRRWILDTFGPGIANHFLLPYNTKIWTLPPEKMSSGYAERYIPVPKVGEIVRGSLGLSQEALGYNATFLYPESGGIESLPKAIASRLATPPECGRRPLAIDWKTRSVSFDDGTETPYSTLISSLPLPDLVALFADPPVAVARAGKRLRATTVTYFNIAARAHGPRRHSWVYYPEPAFPFYRIGSYSTCAPQTAPAGTASFYVEYSHLDPVDADALRERALDDMVRTGLIPSRDDVLFVEMRRIHPAYVLYDRAFDPAMCVILPFLARARVSLVGRYGKWEYAAMEDALLDGIDAAGRARRAGP